MNFQKFVLTEIQRELPRLGNKKTAAGAEAYMKGVAPFLGVQTPARRALTMQILKVAGVPTSDELAKTARALWKLEAREYQYVATDMMRKFVEVADKDFLADHVEYLITQKSWWDSVDSLGTAAVSPLTVKYGCVPLMKKWNKSPNMWLQRAAIQHQRGRKTETDVALLLKFCDDHSDDHEFFIATAIGWALRDLAHHDRYSVTKFLRDHPDLDRVAVREALKHAK